MNILLVEDSVDDRYWLSRLIERVNQTFQLTALTCAEDALTRLQQSSFDLVLTDQNLPGLSGIEMIQELRRRKDWTPVMVLTGRSSIALASNSVTAGAAAFFSKDSLDMQALAQGIEKSQAALVRELDLAVLELDLPAIAEQMRGRVLASIERLKSDMMAIRSRPNRHDNDDDQAALDRLESNCSEIEQQLQAALTQFEASITD